MENLWAVIKFPDEDNAVSAVPTSWLNGNMCYWPPWSRDKVNKAIKNCIPPEETWQKHLFLPMRNNIFESYDTAIKKIEKATEFSDLDSQNELSTSEITAETSKRRKIVKTKWTRFASFEVMDDSDEAETMNHRSHILPEPPILTGGKRRKSIENVSEKEKRSAESPFIFSYSQTTNATPNLFGQPKFTGAQNSKGIEQISDKKIESSTLNSSFQNKVDENINVIHHTTSELQNITEYLRKIIRKQNIIQSTLTEIAEDVNQLKNQIHRVPERFDENNRESIFILLKLPIESQVELEDLEQYLSTDAQLKNAVKEISSSGGKDVYDLIYRATSKLITNGFAAGFSYYGRQKKLKFASLKLNKLLIDAAVNTFSCSEKDAELAISKWLRRCAERAKNEKRMLN